jgi:cytidylate kinase
MKISVPLPLIEKEVNRYSLKLKAAKESAAKQVEPRIITISRMFGAGGISIARMLSDRLGWPFWDKEIFSVLATSSTEEQTRMLSSLDEKTQSDFEAFLLSFSKVMDKQQYFYKLKEATSFLAKSDCILLGRATNLLVDNSLKIFLKASLDTRIKNVMNLTGDSAEECRKEIETRDADRDAFLSEMAQRVGYKQNQMQLAYDLELNTDKFSFEQALEIIICAATQHFGELV